MWKRSPVSLETCGTPGSWQKDPHYDLPNVMDQALRLHASTINIKLTAIPPEWRKAFDEFQKRIGYRFVLRRVQYPQSVKAGQMMPLSSWWLNAGVSPVYYECILAFQRSETGGAV